MAKELCLYSHIYDFVAESFISQMEENKTEDVVIRGNTPGGNVFAGWGMIAKIKEHEGHVKMKVDGVVASMGTFVLVFVEDTEALDVSRIHLHRADGHVNTPEDQAFLDGVNKDLKAKLTVRIDANKLKELKGVTIDELFNPEKVTDVWLTAKEAKAIGLIKKIVKLDPKEISAMNRLNIAATTQEKEESKTTEKKIMNLEELKTKHPEIYAQVVASTTADAKKAGVEEERARIQAWESWRHVDAEAVDKGIKEGKVISMADISAFSAKALSPEFLKKLTADSKTGAVSTKEVEGKEKTEDEKQLEALQAEVKGILKTNYGHSAAATAENKSIVFKQDKA